MSVASDLKWIYDCGWIGFCVDCYSGKIHVGKKTYKNASVLRRKLESLPEWPKPCDENGSIEIPNMD
jgi:hypothetical protein